MMSEAAARAAARAAGISAPVRYDEVTESTNTTALELAEAGAPEWTLVAAAHQTGGRGRLGRAWVDRPGGALMFSVVLRPELEPERAGLLTLLAGASMARACERVGGGPVRCKWPNDLMASEKKIGGILAESKSEGEQLRHVVVGIGINLSEPPSRLPDAGALRNVDAEGLLAAFLGLFRDLYQPSAPGFADEVVGEYRAVSLTIGRRVRARTVDGREVEGAAAGLDLMGNLVVETGFARETVAFGEIAHLGPSGPAR